MKKGRVPAPFRFSSLSMRLARRQGALGDLHGGFIRALDGLSLSRAQRQERVHSTKERLERFEQGLASARERYQKSKDRLTKRQESVTDARDGSRKRLEPATRAVERAKESLKKAELARTKIQVDFKLARDSRTWNLGTSLKSYIHPKIVYKWCKRVDYEWRKLYPSTLQRKFSWIEHS